MTARSLPGAMDEGRRRLYLGCGVIAIVGGVINAVSDLMLRCGPVDGAQITHAYMATMPAEQTLAGALIGAAVGVPLWLAILVPLAALLAPAGRWRSLSTLASLGYLYVVTATYHGAYAFYASTHRLATDGRIAADLAAMLIEQDAQFQSWLGGAWFGGAVVASLCLAAAVLSGRTALRRWSLLFVPAASIVASMASARLPAPVGGYIRPMAGSLVFIGFFVVVTWSVWRASAAPADWSPVREL